MDLSTKYLGLNLEHPIMPGASPFSRNLDNVKALEDAGAPAIVMNSLFEEELIDEELATYSSTVTPAESFGEALTYFPDPNNLKSAPDQYLQQIQKIKKAVNIPVIASLNGSTTGGWLKYAKLISDAGADALELNIYYPTADPAETGQNIENQITQTVQQVKQIINIPLAVKLAPYYSSLANFTRNLTEAGADGLVLFNRLYQPNIDIDNLELIPANPVSTTDLHIRLRWLGILYDKLDTSLAATGGILTSVEAIKAIMAGATVVQMVSALLKNGPAYLATVKQEMIQWMEENDYTSLQQMRGSMSMEHCPDPAAYQRGNYMHTLLSWKI